MPLIVPIKPPVLSLTDIDGKPIDLRGQPLLLFSLFREATCPFCNFRVYELTRNYPDLVKRGLSIVVVFVSPEADVRKFIARQPRPFRMVADPEGTAHRRVLGESSMMGKLWAMIRRMPALIIGMGAVGMRGMFTGNLMPADFLIDEKGYIVETYYGQDAGDHIPMTTVERHLDALAARK